MAKVNLSENKTFLEIDFKKDFGVDLSKDPGMRQQIGQRIIDKIIERTDNNQGIEITSKGNIRKGGPLESPYSEEYAESDDFKAFGKSKDDVDLRLTGDMLGSMDIVKEAGNRQRIGWEDETENAKAFNHNTGDTVPKRPFLGVTNDELEQIKNEFKDQLRKKKSDKKKKAEELVGSLLRELDSGEG